MEQIASLKIKNKIYDYFMSSDGETIKRIDRKGNINSYAYWDIDILTSDLGNKNVIVISMDKDIEDYFLNESEDSYIIDNIKRYKGVKYD